MCSAQNLAVKCWVDPSMILFFEHGRLGNQLFQYCGLKKYFSDHKLVFIGCEDLEKSFDNVDVQFISRKQIERWLRFGLVRRIVFLLSNIRIIGRITEQTDYATFRLVVHRGLIPKVFVPQNVFFQHNDIADKIESSLVVRCDTIKRAKTWLESKGISSKKQELVFVHIRRGDYLNWPSEEFPAVLDLVWYKRAISVMREEINRPVFILMSDDQYYLRDVFEESNNFVISDNVPEIDFAIMSICSHGILSTSSFAWWGGYLAMFVNRENESGQKFLAPKYRAGYRAKRWYPPGLISDWLTYIE